MYVTDLPIRLFLSGQQLLNLTVQNLAPLIEDLQCPWEISFLSIFPSGFEFS